MLFLHIRRNVYEDIHTFCVLMVTISEAPINALVSLRERVIRCGRREGGGVCVCGSDGSDYGLWQVGHIVHKFKFLKNDWVQGWRRRSRERQL